MFLYNDSVKRMREFFQDEKGFIEVPAQSRQSILAACEDPSTISQYIFGGINWPLPQTGQMWLERDLLDNPKVNGVFCITTSYRNEPNPVEGRHDKIFPMFEFESHGDMNDLMDLESGLLHHLGFGEGFPTVKYEDASQRYNKLNDELGYQEEEWLCRDNGNVVFLTDFPQRTHPFWNMKYKGDDIYNKVEERRLRTDQRSKSPKNPNLYKYAME